MSSMPQEERAEGMGLLGWLILLCFAWIVLGGICSSAVAVETIPAHPAWQPASEAAPFQPSQHALEKHGQDAVLAAEAVSRSHGCCFLCQDGRIRCACRMADGRFAVAVFEGRAMVTSFISRSENYIRNMLSSRGCSAPAQVSP